MLSATPTSKSVANNKILRDRKSDEDCKLRLKISKGTLIVLRGLRNAYANTTGGEIAGGCTP